ncbi:hypothetical protein, partial [Neisseria sp. P0015.S002]|uniref:hypothetical protein n=1 Tax=Neisseria sp. P0015.S002 TaxID=3436758 RepID=UPI003F8173DE
PEDRDLIESLLQAMAIQEVDFTRCFAGLADGTARTEFRQPKAFDDWAATWRQRLGPAGPDLALMTRANPRRIPRNHRIEAA